MQNETLLKRSIKDFFTAEILKLALWPLVITAVVLYALFFYAAGSGLHQLEQAHLQIERSQTSVDDNGVIHTQEEKATYEGSSAILNFLLQYSVTTWIVSFLVYTVGTIVVMQLSVLIALFIIGFLTPWIVPIVGKRHYPHIPIQGFGTVAEVTWHFIKTFVVMILLFFALIPFYFIPLLNVVAFNLPFYYLFHRLLNFDVGSTICSKESYLKVMFYKGNSIRLKTGVMYLTTLIPYTALFSVVFFVIYLSHVYFDALQKLPDEANTQLPD